VIDCAVVGPDPLQIVKSGVEIVMRRYARGAFCDNSLTAKWGGFCAELHKAQRGGFCVDTPLSTDRVPIIGAEPNAWKTEI